MKEPQFSRISQSVIALTAFCVVLVANANRLHGQTPNLTNEIQQARAEFQTKLNQWSKSVSADAAKVSEKYRVVFPPDRQTLFPLDLAIPNSNLENQPKLNSLLNDHADALFQLAEKSVADGKTATAYQLLHEVLAHNQNHKEARRILGFVLNSKKQWVRPTRKTTARKASTKHSIVGWARGRYLNVDSAHYRIATTAEEETGLAMARKLERWHNLWRQLYFDYWAADGVLSRWFEGRGGEKVSTRKHRVVFFSSREEYVTTLSDLGVKGVEGSTGYYNEKQKTMFFYHDPENEQSMRTTWLQEQAHQLFQESGVTKKDAIDKANIWAVEAIAMYFESMSEFDNRATFGGNESQRLQFARIRVNRQGFFVPVEKLIAMGRRDFQTDENVVSLYSQSAGLAHFLMLADGGAFRDGFIRYIKLVYQKRTKPDSLAKSTGLSYEELEKQYRRFLLPDARNLQYLSKPELRSEIALGGAKVTNDQVRIIANCKTLNWLQLSGTAIDDRSAETIKKLKTLTQLFVDSTKIGDKFVQAIRPELSSLQELDVAGTSVTDEGLKEIGQMKELRALYLTGTKITDDGLKHLEGLEFLEYLEVSKTKVSAAALNALKKKLPKLN